MGKIIQPDFLDDEQLRNSVSLYTFIAPLKSYQALVARQKRKVRYEADKKAWTIKQKAEKDKAKNTKSRKGKKTSKRKKKEEDGNVKQVYLWHNIDDFEGVEDATDEIDEQLRRYSFNFYIQGIHRKIKQEKARSDKGKNFKQSPYYELRISTDFKRFLSRLIVECIRRFSASTRLLMRWKDAKTVNYATVKTVIETTLTDSYEPEITGEVEYTEDHQALFTAMS